MQKPTKTDKRKSAVALQIADKVREHLRGHPPEVQGAALAELTATWVLGHEPDFRPMLLATHYQAVSFMVESYAKQSDPWKKPLQASEH